MANDNDSVDSNCNSTDLKPRRSNRAKGKPIQPLDDNDENVVINNNIVYKIGDFVYYLDKKQDIYRIGLIEEFKHQKRDKIINKRPEISVKQFYRLDEIPQSVLSNQGEYDTHVMPPNFPEWLRQREIFISDNALSTSCSSLRSLCTVRHFPDLNHAMALFSTTQSSGQVPNSSPRVDHHSLITGKDNGCIPIPKQRDDNTFFYVYSYNARGRKLVATYLEIRVGSAYQVELPELHSLEDQLTDARYIPGAWEQLMWKPNQIPDEVFNVYNMATISIACFSGFGGGVDDCTSVENGRKIASHMLTGQKALDCLHKSQYIMEKAMEIFADNSLPETNKMPFLWTDEEHVLFDESVKIHGKNFLRIKQDKRNKKGRLVGDYVTFYYYWKKNRPKNRKYTTKKNLRSRTSNIPLTEEANNGQIKNDLPTENNVVNDKGTEGDHQSPKDTVDECCSNCKVALPKPEVDTIQGDNTVLSDRMKTLCYKCQHYLCRYGYQRPVEITDKVKTSEDYEDEAGDFEEGINGFDEEEDEDEVDGEEEEEDDDVFQATLSPQRNLKETENNINKIINVLPNNLPLEDKNTLAINKYDFDEEDENVEEVSSLLKRNQAKNYLLRDPAELKTSGYKSKTNESNFFPSKTLSTYSNKQLNKSNNPPLSTIGTSHSSKTTLMQSDSLKPIKRSNLSKMSSNEDRKKIKIEVNDEPSTKSKNSSLNPCTRNQIHESLKSNLSQPTSTVVNKTIDKKNKILMGQNEFTSSQCDTNSPTTSSSSTSNDSSSSADEADTVPLVLRTGSNVKLHSINAEDDEELPLDTTMKDSSDNSYNQMITSIPNIPGVCAVTNVGEPMPQFMQNLSTDLSATQPSSVSDLKITVAEPLYKQLSLRTPVSATSCEITPVTNKIPQLAESGITEHIAQFVNFIAHSGPKNDEGLEETGLNLIRPKKRSNSSFSDRNWTLPHDSPSKLVHHRGDNSTGDSSQSDVPKQMINDYEVVHCSIFGHVLRVLKSAESCARTDLQHITSSLTPLDLEKKKSYINNVKVTETPILNITDTPSQETCKKYEEPKKHGSMPPPIEKNLIHHQSSSKHVNIPPLTHSSNSNNNQSSISNQSHGRRVGNPHGICSPSPVNNRTSSSFPSITSNMVRPHNHMHNSNLISSPANVRPNIHQNPNMQNLSNSSLLADYNNMNKVNMNEFLFHQNPAQTYEEMVKHNELQKLIMLYNLSMNTMRTNPWDQRELLGSGPEVWGGNMPAIPQMNPGMMPIGPDMQALFRSMGQAAVPANLINRPRSATGLNLSQSNSSSQGSSDKPGSGRASVNNHDFQRLQHEQASALAAEGPEVMEILHRLMTDPLYQSLFNLPKPMSAMHMHQSSQNTPGAPLDHALNSHLPFPGLSTNHPIAMTQQLLSLMQAQSAIKPPVSSTFGPTNSILQRPNANDIIQMCMGYNRNQQR